MFNFLSDHYNWKIDHTWLARRFQQAEAGFWERWGQRPPAVKEEAIRLGAIEQLIREAGSQPTRAAVEGALAHLVAGAGTSDCLLEGAFELVAGMARRYRLAIVSNGLDSYTRLCLEHHGLMPFFEVYTISERVNVEKPDPAIIHLTLAQMGLEPSQAVMIGNRLDADILAANRAGCRSVWFRYVAPPPIADAQPDSVITALAELPAACAALVETTV